MEKGIIEIPKGSKVRVDRGLDNVIVGETKISALTANKETGQIDLVYRGWRAEELAEKASFEQAAYIIACADKMKSSDLGDLQEFLKKNSGSISELSAFLKENSNLDEETREHMRILCNPQTHQKRRTVLEVVRIGVEHESLANENAKDKMLLALLEMAAKIPRIASDGYRLQRGLSPLKDIEGSYSERFYYLLTGKEDKVKARYLERLLILYMEHEFNASTYALRETASTLAPPRNAVVTALATLEGPLHGGANAEILNYILKIKSPDEAREKAKEMLAVPGLKIMGFGHRIYKYPGVDQRADFIKKQLKELVKLSDDNMIYEAAAAFEEEVREAKHLPANLDFYAAIYLHLLGIDEALYTPIFAAARSFGWAAHYMEQVSNNKLIRPDADYGGP